MRLYETEGKELFRHYGIRVPKGQTCNAPKRIRACLDHLEMPIMVKAQVLAGGRGKVGGVVTAMTVEEADPRRSRYSISKYGACRCTRSCSRKWSGR